MNTLMNNTAAMHRGVKYEINGDCDYIITCNGRCVSNEVAACNPDPDSQGEIKYLTFEMTSKAIRSAIDCWLEEPFDTIMTRGELLVAQKALDDKRSMLIAIYESPNDDIRELEFLMIKLDGVFRKVEK